MNFLVDAFKRALKHYSDAVGFKFSIIKDSDGNEVIEFKDLPIHMDVSLVNAKFIGTSTDGLGNDVKFKKNVCEPAIFRDGCKVLRVIMDPEFYANKINMIDAIMKKHVNDDK